MPFLGIYTRETFAFMQQEDQKTSIAGLTVIEKIGNIQTLHQQENVKLQYSHQWNTLQIHISKQINLETTLT